MVSRQCVSTEQACAVHVCVVLQKILTIGVKTLVYQNQLPLLKTTHHYRCDVIVRDHPTDLRLCYSDAILQQPKNESFKVSLESFCWSSSVLLLLVVMSVLVAAECTRVTWSHAAVRKLSGKWPWSLGLASTVADGWLLDWLLDSWRRHKSFMNAPSYGLERPHYCTAPHRQSLCDGDVQLASPPSPLPVYHGSGSRTQGRGDWPVNAG